MDIISAVCVDSDAKFSSEILGMHLDFVNIYRWKVYPYTQVLLNILKIFSVTESHITFKV